MADKPRNTGRPAGPRAGAQRDARPGGRPQNGGRQAGKPERGPARPRKVGGVDVNALDRLQQEGLLSSEGRKLLQGNGAGGEGRGGTQGRFRPAKFERERGPRPDTGERGPRPEGRYERPERGPRPEGRYERPERGPRPDTGERAPRPTKSGRGPGFGSAAAGFESVDEQLARSMTRGPRRFGGADRFERGGNRPERGPRPDARGDRFERERGPRPDGERPTRGAGERPTRGADRYERTERRPIPRTVARGPKKLNAAEVEVAERLHKVMARAGVASRRHSEELIQAGRVTVNGRVVTELGTKVVPGQDRVEIDGRPLGKEEDKVYLLLNKPKGYVTTLYDPQGRPKVTDLLGEDIGARIYPVGRLDYDTEGLLLLTNDGELANALMHPAKQVRKTYIAKVRGVPGPAKLRALETGVELEDGITAPADVKMLEVKAPNAATVSIRIHEGRNRQVRRMFEAIGHEVIHLKRTTLGPLHLKDLALGQWRELSEQEAKDLYQVAGLRWGGKHAPKPKAAGRPARPR